MKETMPKQAVLGLVEIINGNIPRQQASDYIDPLVIIHMDTAIHQGIDIWQKWIHLIRNCGQVSELRMEPCEVSSDDQDPRIVNLVIRWSGIRKSNHLPYLTSETYRLRYRVENNRIVEIWSRKVNYVVIFGGWIRYTIAYRLFLGWAILYFKILSLRNIDYRVDRAV